VLGGRLGLVESLQCAVVTLVESPVPDDRRPVQTHHVLDVEQRLDGSRQRARERVVKLQTLILQHLHQMSAVIGTYSIYVLRLLLACNKCMLYNCLEWYK